MPFPVGKSDYPTAADLMQELAIAGMSWAEPDCAIAIAAGIREVETRTSRRFLPTTTTYTYDLPSRASGLLTLRRDLLSISSLSIGGGVKVANTDFWLYPEDAGGDGDPFTSIQLLAPAYYALPAGGRRAVAITGVWGYATTLPEDVWRAMLDAAVLVLTETDRGGASGTISSRTLTEEGRTETEEYSPALLTALRQGRAERVAAVCRRRERTSGYLG